MIAPLQAKLLDETKDSLGESSPKAIKQTIHGDLSEPYTSEPEKNILLKAALDPWFKCLLFLSEHESEETYGRVTAEAAALPELIQPIYLV